MELRPCHILPFSSSGLLTDIVVFLICVSYSYTTPYTPPHSHRTCIHLPVKSILKPCGKSSVIHIQTTTFSFTQTFCCVCTGLKRTMQRPKTCTLYSRVAFSMVWCQSIQRNLWCGYLPLLFCLSVCSVWSIVVGNFPLSPNHRQSASCLYRHMYAQCTISKDFTCIHVIFSCPCNVAKKFPEVNLC